MATTNNVLPAPRAAPPTDGACETCPQPRGADDRFVARVGVDLLQYLAHRLGIPELRFDREPELVPDGWVVYVFHFRLHETPGLPPEFCGPLTVRLVACPEGALCGRHDSEFALFAGGTMTVLLVGMIAGSGTAGSTATRSIRIAAEPEPVL